MPFIKTTEHRFENTPMGNTQRFADCYSVTSSGENLKHRTYTPKTTSTFRSKNN